jgi:hypothetical protein
MKLKLKKKNYFLQIVIQNYQCAPERAGEWQVQIISLVEPMALRDLKA